MASAWGRYALPAALILALAGCGPTPAPAAPASAPAAPANAPASAAPQAPGNAPAASAPAAAPPSLTTVRAGDTLSGTLAGMYIAQEKGYFAEEGLELGTERFPSLEPQITALGTSQIDVAQGGWVPGLFNAIVRGISLRMVGTAAIHAPGRSQLLVAQRDLLDSGELKEYAGLKGRKIARAASLGIATLAIEKALALGGLQDTDVDYVNLGFPDTVAALSNKAVDLAYLSEPFATSSIEQGFAGKWKEMSELVPNHPASIWVYSQRLADEQPDVGRRFMVAMLRGVREYEDAFGRNQGRPEVVAILTKYTGIKDPALYDRMSAVKLPTSGETNVEALQEDLDWLVAKGAVPQPPSLAQVLDTQFTDYAVQRLGPYR